MTALSQQFLQQQFSNDYELVNGVDMHTANPDLFHIPPEVIKRQLRPGHFVELRIDSPRFSVHAADAEKCSCPSCNGELTKPILKHDDPASLVPLDSAAVPSRGWGEDFWIQIIECSEDYFRGLVDNPLVEARLHGLHQGDEILFRRDHVLAVHYIHRYEIVADMVDADLKELAAWVSEVQRPKQG